MPQFIKTGGNTKIEVIYEYIIVMAVIIPNCCSGGNGARISIPNPAAVVSAAINNAPPVCVTVFATAFLTSPVLSAVRRNRCIT